MSRRPGPMRNAIARLLERSVAEANAARLAEGAAMEDGNSHRAARMGKRWSYFSVLADRLNKALETADEGIG